MRALREPCRHPLAWRLIGVCSATLALGPAGPAIGARPLGTGVTQRDGATLHYRASFNIRTFTFIIRTPRAVRVTSFVSPRGFGCGVDPDGALRCVGRRPLPAGKEVRGRLTTQPALKHGARLRLVGFSDRGPIGPFPLA